MIYVSFWGKKHHEILWRHLIQLTALKQVRSPLWFTNLLPWDDLIKVSLNWNIPLMFYTALEQSICCVCNNKFSFDYVSTLDSHKCCSKYFVLSIVWLNRQAFYYCKKSKTTELLGVIKRILPLPKHFSPNISEAWGTKDQMNVRRDMVNIAELLTTNLHISRTYLWTALPRLKICLQRKCYSS